MFLTTLILATSLATPSETELTWFEGPFMSAIGAAAKEHKPIVVYFWSDQSAQCAKLYQETLTKPETAQALQGFTLVSANTGDKAGYALVERFGIKTLPTLLVLDAETQPDDAILGHISVSNLISEIGRIQRNEGTVTTLRAAVNEAPKDLKARQTLAIKLSDVGNHACFVAERAKVFELDPKFAHLPSAELRLWQIQEEAGKTDEEIGAANLEPMKQFLTKCAHKEIRFDGWRWVAEVSQKQEKPGDYRSAMMTAWESVPEKKVAMLGNHLAAAFYEGGETLSKQERKFALEVAQQSLAKVESWSTQEGCEDRCPCEGCTEGCVGPWGDEMLPSRQLYLARAYETLACCYALNGKRREALTAVERSLELDPENESFLERREELKSRG